MQLTVVSHKPIWRDAASPSGFASKGGFPFQMEALSQCFSATRLLLAESRAPKPSGLVPLTGHRLSVEALPEPGGSGFLRKARLPLWLLRHGGRLWREISAAEAVHALVPGDLGTLGLWIALFQKKRLFVRHCGTWNSRNTAAERHLATLLPRIAGLDPVVVTATGGGPKDPAPEVSWIFSTTLSTAELETLPVAVPWQKGEPLRLITVGRVTEGKNQRAVLEALPAIRDALGEVELTIVGEGPALAELRNLRDEMAQKAPWLASAVTLTGNLSHEDVLDRLVASHLFVFPTRVAEGFPKAVVEALACGLPVLAPPVSVLSHLLFPAAEDPEQEPIPRGWLLKGTSPEVVAKTVLQAAADPRDMAARGAAARLGARGLTLEAWRETLRRRLEAAWGRPLATREAEP